MRKRVTEIEKSKIDRGKNEKAFGPLRPPNSFSDMSTKGTGLGGDPLFADFFAQKPKGLPPAPAPATSKVAGGMKLGRAKKTNQFLESLKAEGELISEDTQPSGIQSGLLSVPPSDPIAVAIEEKINVTVKRDGGIHNFDIQGTLALQVLNDTVCSPRSWKAGMTQETQCWNGQLFLLTNPTAVVLWNLLFLQLTINIFSHLGWFFCIKHLQ
ncbi:hypothetical protein C2845_PM08G30170 [Panicum miliaceum]|uniref:Coatomer subunit delta n=1 Tax=Panicum miliaceum TaxID=4540 RepID=A0A3L6R0C9_PANMI|nr:hypothetical protein C2845_PM08G30170 [Panicum miliaceum]